MATLTPEQLAHLEENRHLVGEHQCDPHVDVHEWATFAEEDEPYEAYYCMCLDIGIEPLKPHPGVS